jgi:predicted GTPase
MDTDDTEISDVSDDEEINNIVKKNKKPLVIINKIDGKVSKKQPVVPQPTAIFV